MVVPKIPSLWIWSTCILGSATRSFSACWVAWIMSSMAWRLASRRGYQASQALSARLQYAAEMVCKHVAMMGGKALLIRIKLCIIHVYTYIYRLNCIRLIWVELVHHFWSVSLSLSTGHPCFARNSSAETRPTSACGHFFWRHPIPTTTTKVLCTGVQCWTPCVYQKHSTDQH